MNINNYIKPQDNIDIEYCLDKVARRINKIQNNYDVIFDSIGKSKIEQNKFMKEYRTLYDAVQIIKSEQRKGASDKKIAEKYIRDEFNY